MYPDPWVLIGPSPSGGWKNTNPVCDISYQEFTRVTISSDRHEVNKNKTPVPVDYNLRCGYSKDDPQSKVQSPSDEYAYRIPNPIRNLSSTPR